ncbi:MAG: DUF1961 family protein [Kiritimatiellae bacterium]|nr:DUF1961 family protein [Kiritimatiellia bacterium]
MRNAGIAITFVALATAARVTHSQVLEFRLDGALAGKAGAEQIAATLGPGSAFVESAEGQGVQPGADGHAVSVPVPNALWTERGTLAFRFQPSRTVAIGEPTLTIPLVESPALKLELEERRNHSLIRMQMPGAGKPAVKGSLFLSHLTGGQWYHLALSWDAAKGRLETYLNGALQQHMRMGAGDRPWTHAAVSPAGPLGMGGGAGDGARHVRIAIDSVQLYAEFMEQPEVARTLAGRGVPALHGEGRTPYPDEPLDLSPYTLTLVYEANFSKRLDVVTEDALFRDGQRSSLPPAGKDWVFEGQGRVWTEGGLLHMTSAGSHVVLWNTRVFPGDFLLEFAMTPDDAATGLAIVFFCTTAKETGGGIFELPLPYRGGDFKKYHSGALNGYHVSYWAGANQKGGVPRRTCNLRKNCGFYMPTCGIDRIWGEHAGPHRVRLLKVGGKIRVEARGMLAAAFDDDGKTYGPVWRGGAIGLRQMKHAGHCAYTHFKVWRVE